MAARATRSADITASVPELTKRRLCTHGMRLVINSASSRLYGSAVPRLQPRASAASAAARTPASAWPRISGPNARQKSMYSRPSTSRSNAPEPELMKRGVPPTPLKARTGECTPPGATRLARANNCPERPPAALKPRAIRAHSARHR